MARITAHRQPATSYSLLLEIAPPALTNAADKTHLSGRSVAKSRSLTSVYFMNVVSSNPLVGRVLGLFVIALFTFVTSNAVSISSSSSSSQELIFNHANSLRSFIGAGGNYVW
jgi:hypothetical protein